MSTSVATHALPKTLNAAKPMQSKEILLKTPPSHAKGSVRSQQGNKKVESKVKTPKSVTQPGQAVKRAVQNVKAKGQPRASVAGPARSSSNITEAVSMIVTGHKDIPKGPVKVPQNTDKCQALDLSSPVKNIPKSKFTAPVDNEPLNLVIHSKSPDSTKLTSSTKVIARSSSVENTQSGGKSTSSTTKPRRASTSQTGQTSTPKDDVRTTSQVMISKDAIAKLRGDSAYVQSTFQQ